MIKAIVLIASPVDREILGSMKKPCSLLYDVPVDFKMTCLVVTVLAGIPLRLSTALDHAVQGKEPCRVELPGCRPIPARWRRVGKMRGHLQRGSKQERGLLGRTAWALRVSGWTLRGRQHTHCRKGRCTHRAQGEQLTVNEGNDAYESEEAAS